MREFIIQYLKDNLVKDLIYTAIILGIAALVILSKCGPPATAYTLTFNVNGDSSILLDPDRHNIGYWENIISNDSVVVSWADDSIVTTYDKFEGLQVTIREGSHQLHIYPKNPSRSSPSLMWEYWTVIKVSGDMEITAYPSTKYALILLDTTGTWDYNTGYKSQGFQYVYINTDSISSYHFDYYCGVRGQDSTLIDYNIAHTQKATIYLVKCFQSYRVGFKVNLNYVFADVVTQFVTR